MKTLNSMRKGKITIKEMSEILKMSERQVYRIIRKYKQECIQGLYHGNRNKPSRHSYDVAKKGQIMSLIRDKYYDCGVSYASELLEEYEGIKINRETLRLWMHKGSASHTVNAENVRQHSVKCCK